MEATLTDTPVATAAPRGWKARLREELRFFAKLAGVLLLVFTFVFGHFKIPSESMQPTLEVGDHLYVSKHPYGYGRHSLPFGLHKLPIGDWHLFSRLPERGDVVVFRNPNSGIITIKRAVGLPGDSVETVNGRLAIDGKVLPRDRSDAFSYRTHRHGYVTDVTEYAERLPGEDGQHLIWEVSDGYALDNAGPFTVPEGHIFVMGDNRDMSVDSRDRLSADAPGFVPVENLIGRAEMMVFTFNRCAAEAGLRCPGRRWFEKL